MTELSSRLTQHDLRAEIFYGQNSKKGKTETCHVFKTSVSRGGSDRTTPEKFQLNDLRFFTPLNFQTGVLDLSSSDGALLFSAYLTV